MSLVSLMEIYFSSVTMSCIVQILATQKCLGDYSEMDRR